MTYVRLLIALLIFPACSDRPPGAASSGELELLAETDTVGLPATNFYEIQTPYGHMVVRLFDETPQHRNNFKRLVAEQYFDSTTFHRVIRGFMIQGGDPNSRDEDPSNDGVGGPGYLLPAEIRPDLFHRRGVLAAAREGDEINPDRASSGSQFYIVQGIRMDSLTLNEVEQRVRAGTDDPSFQFSPEARRAYQTEGGAPHLDRQYTIFGELVEGFDVLDRIGAVETPRSQQLPAAPDLLDRPSEDIWMVIRPLPEYPGESERASE